jgi:hypothetical protein
VDGLAAPGWLRWLLVFAALGFMTLALLFEGQRIATTADCLARAEADGSSCPPGPGPYEIPLTLGAEVVILVVVGREFLALRQATGGGLPDDS